MLLHKLLHFGMYGGDQIRVDALVHVAYGKYDADTEMFPALDSGRGWQGSSFDIPPKVQVRERQEEKCQIVQNGKPNLHSIES